MSEGELRLTGDSFDKLKNTVDDLAKSATQARDNLEKIFTGTWFKPPEWDEFAGQETFSKLHDSFNRLFELVDKLNTKLAITSVRMQNIFKGQASEIKEVAKGLAMLNKAASKGKSVDPWVYSEGFNPPSEGGGGTGAGNGGGGGGKGGRERNPDVTVRTHARVQAKVRRAQEKQEEDYLKLKSYYRKLEQKDAERASKQQEKLRKDDMRRTFVPLTSITSSAIGAREKLAEKAAKDKAKQEEKDARDKAKQAAAKANRTSPLDRMLNNLVEMGRKRFYLGQIARNNFSGNLGMSGGGNGQGFLSRYGPGITGVLGKFRVFQKPFPGSERNVFALGDIAAAFNNIVYGAGSAVEDSFRAVTSSAFAVNRTFTGLVSGVATLIPVLGPTVGALIATISDLVIGAMEKLASVVAGVIGGLTRFATALTGFATRAVEAAANFTEAVNAARVVAGPEAARGMSSFAIELQREFGVSATDMMRGMGRIAGQLRQQGGFSAEEAGMQAQEIAKYVADIASVNNVPFENVMRDVMSGIVGRLTPLRKDIISMSAPQLDAMAKASGMKNPALRTDYAARTRMFIEDFARQAGLFVGDLERTRYEFANQRRKFLGSFEALFLSVGRILEPFARAILITANELMDSVFDMVLPMSADPYETFSKAIDGFTYYVSYARAVIIELAKALYESRTAIVDWAIYLGKAFATLALSLTRYSVNVLNVFADLISGLGGLLPIVEMLGKAMIDFSNLLQTLFPSDNKVTKGTLEKELNLILSGRSEYGRPNSPQAMKRVDFLQSRLESVKKSGVSGMLSDSSDRVRNGASQLERFSAKLSDAFGSLDLNKEELANFQQLLRERLKPALSQANEIPPAPPLSMAGSLVRYFSPEAFRDTVQEREVANAQIETAKNTAEMVRLLSDVSIKGTTLTPLSMGAAGVLGGMMPAVVSKP